MIVMSRPPVTEIEASAMPDATAVITDTSAALRPLVMARPGRARPHGGAPPHQDRRVAGTGGTPGPHVGHERPSRRADVRVDRGASDASTRHNGLNLNGRELGNADAFRSAPAEK